MPLNQILSALSSDSPTPGAGSACALAGALGAALVAMVARLTLGRDRYADFHDEMRGLLSRAEGVRDRLVDLADADVRVYRAVIAASRLPNSSAEERARRISALQVALRPATQVPLEIASASLEALELAARVAAHGDRKAAGDAAVAALPRPRTGTGLGLAHAALVGAARNARINAQQASDPGLRETCEGRVQPLLSRGESLLAEALAAADA